MFFSSFPLQVVDIQPYIPYITGFGSYYNFVFGIFIASKEKLNCNEEDASHYTLEQLPWTRLQLMTYSERRWLLAS